MTNRDTMSFPPDAPHAEDIETDRSSQSVVPSSARSRDPTESGAPENVLTAIADPDCQTILAAIATEPHSVSDIVEQCDIPTATAYRKVDMLVDAGLLRERIQIRPYGRNEREYSLRIENVRVNLTECGTPEATVTLAHDGSSPRRGHAVTDGGQSPDGREEEADSRSLGSIFVDVTGTEELVDEQQTERATRHLAVDSDRSVSDYVSVVTRHDGLSESLPKPGEETER